MRPISSGDINMRGESRYTVIVAAAKRARQLLEGDTPLVKTKDATKPVTIALEELNAGRVHWIRTRDGIK